MKRDLSTRAAIGISLAAFVVIGLLGWLLFLRPSGASGQPEIGATLDTPESPSVSDNAQTDPGQPAPGQTEAAGDTPTASSDQ